ncbi:hypothetical protein PIB30_108761, partial [Stylosanthes scabra]|nr:hypothetical protein [Stylosanthes scabra]
MRGRARICVEEHAYACYMKAIPSHLGVATHFIRATHMRRNPRICVDSHLVHVPGSRCQNLKCDHDFTSNSPSTHRRRRPTNMRGRHSKQLDDPRLSQQSMAPSLSRPTTHMRGKLPHHVLSHILEEVERDPSLA